MTILNDKLLNPFILQAWELTYNKTNNIAKRKIDKKDGSIFRFFDFERKLNEIGHVACPHCGGKSCFSLGRDGDWISGDHYPVNIICKKCSKVVGWKDLVPCPKSD